MPLNIVYTAQASYTAHCMAGTGDAAVGMAVSESIISQRDADRKALSLAAERAVNSLQCAFPVPPEEPVFYNDEQSVSNTCASGQADVRPPFDPSRTFISVVAAGAVYSTTSKEDADQAALLKAQYMLLEQLLEYCQTYYQNAEQTYNYTCPMPKEGTNSATTPPNTYVSFVSQADADAQALAAAEAAAIAGATCVDRYYNTQQTATVSCESPLIGPDGLGIVAAGTYLDYTQEAADAAAYADALAIATAAAAANCITQFANTKQTFTATCEDEYGPGYAGPPSYYEIEANTYFSTISQEDADAKALAAAEVYAITFLMCYPV